jgi:hypothetical protein
MAKTTKELLLIGQGLLDLAAEGNFTKQPIEELMTTLGGHMVMCCAEVCERLDTLIEQNKPAPMPPLFCNLDGCLHEPGHTGPHSDEEKGE